MACAFFWQNSKVGIDCACPNCTHDFTVCVLYFVSLRGGIPDMLDNMQILLLKYVFFYLTVCTHICQHYIGVTKINCLIVSNIVRPDKEIEIIHSLFLVTSIYCQASSMNH